MKHTKISDVNGKFLYRLGVCVL